MQFLHATIESTDELGALDLRVRVESPKSRRDIHDNQYYFQNHEQTLPFDSNVRRMAPGASLLSNGEKTVNPYQRQSFVEQQTADAKQSRHISKPIKILFPLHPSEQTTISHAERDKPTVPASQKKRETSLGVFITPKSRRNHCDMLEDKRSIARGLPTQDDKMASFFGHGRHFYFVSPHVIRSSSLIHGNVVEYKVSPADVNTCHHDERCMQQPDAMIGFFPFPETNNTIGILDGTKRNRISTNKTLRDQILARQAPGFESCRLKTRKKSQRVRTVGRTALSAHLNSHSDMP